MAKALTYPTSFAIRKPFEELALFWKWHAGWPMQAARIDGEMEITIDMAIEGGDWTITDLWISADNGRTGKLAEGALLNLCADDDERFYLLVLDAITHQYGTRIEQWVQDELATARYEVAA